MALHVDCYVSCHSFYGALFVLFVLVASSNINMPKKEEVNRRMEEMRGDEEFNNLYCP